MTGRIPRAFIDEVLARTSLVEFIDSHVSLMKRGTNYLACCPFHHEKTPSFNVIPDKQFYYCFGCGASGNAISFAMNYLRKNFVESIEELASRLGLEIPKEAGLNLQHHVSYQKIYGFLDEVSLFYHKNLQQNPEAQAYLNQRGLTQTTIEHFELGYASEAWHDLSKAFPKAQQMLIDTGMLVKNDKGNIYDRYRSRIMFPIRDKRGRVIGFGGRVIDPRNQPKYLNSPETTYFHKSKELYGLYQVQQLAPDSIVIVEGYMDVIALYQYGVQNAVATLGTATTQTHIQTLLKTAKTLIFCFDGDNAGRKAASRALHLSLPLVHDDENIKFMFLPEGEDPDSLVQKQGSDVFCQEVNNAMSIDAFLLKELHQESPPHDTASRSKFIHLARPLIAGMRKGVLKELLIDNIARLVRMDRNRVLPLLTEPMDEGQLTLAAPAQTHAMHSHSMPSVMKIAAALMVQAPDLMRNVSEELNYALLNDCGNQLLISIIKCIAKGVQSTAQLLEYWRDSEQYGVLAKLAIMPLNLPMEGREAELMGALKKIERNTLQNKIDQLLFKANTESLSLEEKQLLQQMIKQKQMSLM